MKVHLISIAVALLWIPASVHATGFPIAQPGTECLPVIVGGSDPIVATYQGNSAAFSNDLYLMLDDSGQPADDGNLANDRFIFNNHASPVGGMVNLGSFPVGTQLIFRLHVNNTGNDFFSGPAGLNPDGHCHARAQAAWMPGETLVSFEDLLGGPFDYNDLSFSFTNTTTSVITLAPPLATNPAGTAHTVTAAIHDASGAPQAGTVVAFTIVSGPNVGATGTCAANADCTTDVTGQVSFTYLSNGSAGTDQIVACFTDITEQRCSQPVIKIWTGCGPDGTPCDDGNACTSGETCSDGSCVDGEPVVCPQLDPCHVSGECDPSTGLCTSPAAPDGTDCDDGNACTVGDSCFEGTCLGGERVVCPSPDSCHLKGVCDPNSGRCMSQPVPEGTPCDLGDSLCNVEECDGLGSCVAIAVVDCFPDACNESVCGPKRGTCHLDPHPDQTPCDDGDSCTESDVCIQGRCIGGAGRSCDDQNECTLDTCDAASGCQHDTRSDCGSQMCTLVEGVFLPAGTLTSTVDVNGDVTVVFTELTDIDDNSYGANRVNWPHDHKLQDLAGSDKAQFVFKDGAGHVVLDAFLDYLSTKPGTPSGYGSLGVERGDGRVNLGSASWLLDWETSIAADLNETGYCLGGHCVVSGTDLLKSSPPTDPPGTSYHASPEFAQWVFPIVYMVKVSHLAFGFSGFGGVSVPFVHNSPAKVGSSKVAIGPCPCPDCDDGDPCTIDLCVAGRQDDHGDDHADDDAGDAAQAGPSAPAASPESQPFLSASEKDSDRAEVRHAEARTDDHGDGVDGTDGAHCTHTPNPSCAARLRQSHLEERGRLGSEPANRWSTGSARPVPGPAWSQRP